MPGKTAWDAALNVLADDAAKSGPVTRAGDAVPSQGNESLDWDAVVKMIDTGEATIAPPRPTSTTHRGTNIETSALPTPGSRTVANMAAIAGLEAGIDQPSFMEQAPSDTEVKAAAAGVLHDKPAPAGHFLSSFGYNQEEQLEAYRKTLTEHYGRPVRVEIGPATGEIEYEDPETGRFALARPPGGGLADVEASAGGALVMIPEALFGIGAALSTKSPWIVTSAAAGAAGLFDIARLEIGRALGINQKMTHTDAAAAALGTFAESEAAGLGFDRAVQFSQFIRNAIKGDPVRYAAQARRMGIDPEEAATLQSTLNDALEAERMRLSARNDMLPPELRREIPEARRFSLMLGEATGNTHLLAMQAAFEQDAVLQQVFGVKNAERMGAAKDFYDLLGKPYTTRGARDLGPAPGRGVQEAEARFAAEKAAEKAADEGVAAKPSHGIMGEQETFEAIRETAQTRLDYAIRRETEDLARYQADAELAIQSVETLPVYQLGSVVRGVQQVEEEAFEARAKELSAKIRAVAGDAPFIENKHLSDALGELDEETRLIFFKSLAAARRKSRHMPPKEIQQADGLVVDHPLYRADQKWSFGESWATLSELKRLVRESSEGKITEAPDTAALQRMIGAIENDLHAAAGKTPLGTMYDDFVGWYKREVTRMNSGVVGDLFRRDGAGGRFRVQNSEVFKEVFPATSARGGYGIERTQEFMGLIRNDPQAIQAFRQSIADDWRGFVTDETTGRVNPVKHRQWISMHQAQLRLKFPGLAPEEQALKRGGMEIADPLKAGEPLFTLQERRAIENGVGVEKALQAREVKYKAALDRVNKRFEAKLANFDNMGQVLNLVRNKNALDGRAARDLVQMLNTPDTADVLRGFRAHYLKDMRNTVMTGRLSNTQERILNPLALRKFLYGQADGESGQIAVVKELFGQEYAKGLTTLERALRMTMRETSQRNRSNTSGWWKVAHVMTRLHFGVLSREGLAVSSGKILSKTAMDRAMARALMNPVDLKKLMSVWDQDIRTRKAAAVLGTLGVSVPEFD